MWCAGAKGCGSEGGTLAEGTAQATKSHTAHTKVKTNQGLTPNKAEDKHNKDTRTRALRGTGRGEEEED